MPLLFLLVNPHRYLGVGPRRAHLFPRKFRKEPPDGLGVTLWWKSAVVGAIFLPLLWFIVEQ